MLPLRRLQPQQPVSERPPALIPADPPFRQADWPVPAQPVVASALRTWVYSALVLLTTAADPFLPVVWANPPVPVVARETLTNTSFPRLAGQGAYYGAPGQVPAYDYPNPRGPARALSLRVADPPNLLATTLVGQGTYYGAPGEAPTYDYPNPRGPRYPSELRTWPGASPALFLPSPNMPPLVPMAFPNPLPVRRAWASLGTWIQTSFPPITPLPAQAECFRWGDGMGWGDGSTYCDPANESRMYRTAVDQLIVRLSVKLHYTAELVPGGSSAWRVDRIRPLVAPASQLPDRYEAQADVLVHRLSVRVRQVGGTLEIDTIRPLVKVLRYDSPR